MSSKCYEQEIGKLLFSCLTILKKEQCLPAQNFHGVLVYVDSCLDVTVLKKVITIIY